MRLDKHKTIVYKNKYNATSLWYKQENIAVPFQMSKLMVIKSKTFWQMTWLMVEPGLESMLPTI